MKRLMMIFAIALATLATACAPSYDDSELRQEIDNLKEQLKEVETLLNASANNLTITSVVESDGGFLITFSDGSSITINHGKDGADGEDGDDGKDGTDGKNGTDGKDGEDGETLIDSIIIGTENVTFILTNGKTVIIPLEGYYNHLDAPINFLDNTTKVLCVMAWDTNDDQELSYAEAAAVTEIGNIFTNTSIIAFRELEHFTSLTTIPKEAFYGCSLLKAITLPEGIKSIGDEAFRNCHELAEINIPEGVTALGERMFQNCEKLTAIEIPATVEELPTYLFYTCTTLADITLHEGLKTIGERAFQSCYALKEIVLPNSVVEMKEYAFYYCEGLESITLSEGMTEVPNSAFYNCESLKSITLPTKVTSVGNYAFRNCTSLATVSLPQGLLTIGNYSFCNCSSIAEITIPASVTSIGGWCFEDCTSLVKVWCHPVEPPTLGSDGFAYNGTGRTIYVPTASLEAYKSADVWKYYAIATF